jgi:multidrug efflux pump subunit AcrA (membrane-fusion protein)
MRRTAWLIGLLLIGTAGVVGFRQAGSASAAGTLPTAPARKGEFEVIVRARGELKARRSVQVTAPVNVPELRIVWLAPQGGKINSGETVVRFDPSSVQNQLREKEAALKQAQAAVDQAVAEAKITEDQNRIETATAQYQVEKAKLEVSKAEIVSRLQAEESKVDLGLAETKERVQKAAGDLKEASDRAKIASLTRARDKAKDEAELMRYRLSQMEVKAPLTGVIHFLPNYSQGWLNAKPFKVGDQVWPGAAVAEIPDLQTLEMEGKIEEIDRGRISEALAARVRIDSLPEITFPAKLSMLSPMTVMGWEWPPTRTFRAFASLEKIDPRLQPSMNGQMDVVIDRIKDAISVPSKAVFTRNGKPVVYVAEKGLYKAVEVQVLARNPDETALKGLSGGVQVALVEPEKKDQV